MTRAFLFAASLSLLLGCSSKDSDKDSSVPPDLFGPAVEGNCGPGVYPCGPYGYNNGQVASNMIFQGFQDPDEQCKKNSDKQIDLAKPVLISFKDFFLGNPAKSCAPRKLLWVMVSAGWCVPCMKEVPQVQLDYASGKLDGRVAVLNVVIETDAHGTPANFDFLKAWQSTLKVPYLTGTPVPLTFPLAIDPQLTLGHFFDKNQLPFNLLIELSSMKIIYQQSNSSISTIYDQLTTYFTQHP